MNRPWRSITSAKPRKVWQPSSGACPSEGVPHRRRPPSRVSGRGRATQRGALELAAIYCGGSFAIAMLERLVYSAIGTVPESDRYVVALVPEELIETLDESAVPDWRQAGSRSARDAGDHWLARGTSAALSIPSAVTGIDRNLLLNPAHPQFGQITVGPELPVAWDRRLFGRPTI